MAEIDLNSPYELPCGLKLQNRLVKAALAEALADKGSLPGKKIVTMYQHFADGGWGMLLTGNVQVDAKHLGSPEDVAVVKDVKGLSDDALLEQWKAWASKCQSGGTPTLVQINHPGRQAPVISRKGKALAPSAIPLSLGPGLVASFMRHVAFGTPKEMTKAEIDLVIQQFVDAAQLAQKAGFAGVQLHCAHGYLLSQFLSPTSNTRTDEYGGSARKRARIVKEIIEAIRKATSEKFCIALKINSADQQGYNGLEDSLEQIDEIATAKPDLVEISGGSYEKATMMSEDETPEDVEGGLERTDRTVKREAFFIEYAQKVREKFPTLPLMVTGGFRSRVGMRAALQSGGCDLVGIGRPSSVKPHLPKELILNKEVKDEDARIPLKRVPVPWVVQVTGVKPLTAGLVTVHYQKELRKLATSAA